jgi:hypothetical protein
MFQGAVTNFLLYFLHVPTVSIRNEIIIFFHYSLLDNYLCLIHHYFND